MMLVHSCIYYRMHTTVISDDLWQELANELKELQSTFKEHIDWYDKEFKDWNGDTGMHLPFDSWVISKAVFVIKLDADFKAKEEAKEEIEYIYY